jgi:hypothetical protein
MENLTTYTINLTPAQQKALEYVAYDPQEWIENAVFNRCRISIDEIVTLEVERITSQGGEISGTKEDIVLAASIESAKERTDKMIDVELSSNPTE